MQTPEASLERGAPRSVPEGFGTLQRPRVCHIAATTEGAAWLFEQVRDLRDRFGCDVSVVLNGESGKLVDRFREAGIRVLVSDFDFLGSGDLFALPKKIVKLTKLLRHERFDVVQTHLFHSMVIGRIASWLADVPVRLSMIAGPFHLEAYTPRWIDAATQWMETALVPSCDHSRTLYMSMGVSSDRIHVIYYGPDETRFDPAKYQAADLRSEFGWGSDVQLIGMIAYFYGELGVNRWTPPAAQGRSVKSQADLIRAMPEILGEFPNARLLFIGSGWEESGRQHLANMQKLVSDLGLSENVKFAGYRDDVPQVLKSLDVAVQASVSENLGGSIEGLLMEAPMVATRVGGLVDSVRDGTTGLLAEPGDSQSLANAIRQLLRDPERARALGRAGRLLMLDKFTLRKTVEDEYYLYQRLLADAPAGYRLHKTLIRAGIGAGVSAYLAARYRFLDAWLLPSLDAGWRPWHMVRLRLLVLRIAYGFRRRVGGQSPDVIHASTAGFGNDQFRSVAQVAPPPVFPGLRMAYYRFLSAIGRLKLGWGLRAKIRRIFHRGAASS